MIKKILLGLLITVIIIILLVIGVFSFQGYRTSKYWEYTDAVGTIERKYTAFGEYDVSSTIVDAPNPAWKNYQIYYPTELETMNKQYPVVVMANGTGYSGEKYKEVFKHVASWGFIVIGNQDEQSRTGESSEATLEYLVEQNSQSDSIFHGKIDLENIGIAGHSQGGVAAINAVTKQANGSLYKTIYTSSATSPFWGQESELGLDWSYDLTQLDIPYFAVTGATGLDAGTAKDFTATEGQGISPLWAMKLAKETVPSTTILVMARMVNRDHGEMLRDPNGYMIAWFMYYLQDDETARQAFFGEDAEIFTNSNWQDVYVRDSISE